MIKLSLIDPTDEIEFLEVVLAVVSILLLLIDVSYALLYLVLLFVLFDEIWVVWYNREFGLFSRSLAVFSFGLDRMLLWDSYVWFFFDIKGLIGYLSFLE